MQFDNLEEYTREALVQNNTLIIAISSHRIISIFHNEIYEDIKFNEKIAQNITLFTLK